MFTESNTYTTPGRHSGSRPRNGLWRILLGALLGVLTLPAMAAHPYEQWADDFGIDLNVSYDGTRVMEFQGGRFEAREHRAPGKMYTETQMGNMSSGVILREDLGKAYILMPSMGFYRESSLEDGMMQAGGGMEFSQIEEVGSETVNGHPSTKFKTRFENQEGKGAGFFWVTDSGVPIKMDMIYSSPGEKGQRISMELTEFHLREQDPAIFELPDGLQPMNMGSLSGLGAMMQQGGTDPAPADETSTEVPQDVSAEQQACLERAIKKAEEEQAKAKKKRGFGRLMRAASRVASRFGSSEIAQISSDVYTADATAADISAAAKDLGITEDEIENCRQP